MSSISSALVISINHNWICNATNCMLRRSLVTYGVQTGPDEFYIEQKVVDPDTHAAARILMDTVHAFPF